MLCEIVCFISVSFLSLDFLTWVRVQNGVRISFRVNNYELNIMFRMH